MQVNNPEYDLIKVFGLKDADGFLTSGILFDVKEALAIPVLNYQYGDIKELNETLKQWQSSTEHSDKRFPLVWVQEPFTVKRDSANFFGRVNLLRVFIIKDSVADWKAEKRREVNFDPVILPIYRELLNQMSLSPALLTGMPQQIAHSLTNRYFLGEQDLSVFNDVIDCTIVEFTDLKINHNLNCVPNGMINS